jgi:hypothetical protein
MYMVDDPTSERPAPVPGRRFVERWEQRRAERERRSNPVTRFGRLLLGVLVLLAAIPIGAIPGPGGIGVTLAGLYLLAGEVRWIARLLDWGELQGRPHAERGMRWWMHRHVRVVRIVLAFLVVGPLFVLLLRGGAYLLLVIWTGALTLLLLLDVIVLLAGGVARRARRARGTRP